MVCTVTSGYLKIIEGNVNGIGNKHVKLKDFLQRQKKKADIFCIVELKTTQENKLEEVFAKWKYKVGALYCRQTGPGGGVAIMVHESLTGVNNAEDKFREELNQAREMKMDIAVVQLDLKPKDLWTSELYVFVIYRRPPNVSKVEELTTVLCNLIQKVKTKYNGTALFTGDFNINNNKEGQKTRSTKDRTHLQTIFQLGYRLTHEQPSHSQGSTLNNFLVPKNMRINKKTTLSWGFNMKFGSTLSTPNLKVKEPDHSPIQIVIELENRDGDFDINAPGTSGTQRERRSWFEDPDGVIMILDDSDDEDLDGPTVSQKQSHSLQVNPGKGNTVLSDPGIGPSYVKIEGRPGEFIGNSRVGGVQSDYIGQSSSRTHVLQQVTPSCSSINNEQPECIQPTIRATNHTSSFPHRNAFHAPSNTSAYVTMPRNFQPFSSIQTESNHSNVFPEESGPPIVTTERMYREVQMIRPDPRPTPMQTPMPQFQDEATRQRELLQRQFEELDQLQREKEQEVRALRVLDEIRIKKMKILEEIRKTH